MILDFFKTFKQNFARTKQSLVENIASIFSKTTITAEDWNLFEATLYKADFGPTVVELVLERMRVLSKTDKMRSGMEILRQVLEEALAGAEGTLTVSPETLQVVLFLGINGVGKTTTVAKVAHLLKQEQNKVLLGSCDTFRAAADQQLKTWAERLQVDCIGSQQGADAAAVGFDVCQAGMHRGYQWVLLDTAGRLHNKVSLVEELKKMVRVLHKCDPTYPQHRWLVLDGSLGTNSIVQAELFHEAIGLTGIIVTKLDGTSKGGALLGVYNALHVPIYFVGSGEAPKDLQRFSVQAYIDAILGA